MTRSVKPVITVICLCVVLFLLYGIISYCLLASQDASFGSDKIIDDRYISEWADFCFCKPDGWSFERHSQESENIYTGFMANDGSNGVVTVSFIRNKALLVRSSESFAETVASQTGNMTESAKKVMLADECYSLCTSVGTKGITDIYVRLLGRRIIVISITADSRVALDGISAHFEPYKKGG